jgi:hypothetical protein
VARLYLMDFAPQPLILSIEDSVGRDATNKREDVLLVQFFIYVTAQNNKTSWGWLIDRAVPRPWIDGVYGPRTQDWIDRFQDSLKHKLVIVDGRIDPILKGVSATRIGGPYMMYLLNVSYYNAFGPDSIGRITNHPLFPREVARTFVMHGRSW